MKSGGETASISETASFFKFEHISIIPFFKFVDPSLETIYPPRKISIIQNIKRDFLPLTIQQCVLIVYEQIYLYL